MSLLFVIDIYSARRLKTKKLRPKGTCPVINSELDNFITEQSKFPECMQVATKL